MSEMRKLTRYFGLLDGHAKTWNATTERVFDDLFHPSVQIVGKLQAYNFDEWKAWYRQSLEDGLAVDMEHFQVLEPGSSIQWKISVHNANNGTRFSHTARGIFEDGQLIKTEPLDPAVYDLMTQHAAQQKRKPVCIL